MRLGITGFKGKMGRALLNEAKNFNQKELFVSALHSRDEKSTQINGITITDDYSYLANNCDIIIDFTRPKASLELMELCVVQNRPIVCGTTGFTSAEMDRVRELSKELKIFYSANMSLGIAILSRLMQNAITTFNKNNVMPQVSILERHHRHKADKPSGTAMLLASKANGTNSEITPEIVSLRYGDNIMQNEVIISTDMEVLTLQHQANNRSVFAAGAIAAAKFTFKQGKNGLYTMDDIVKV